MELRVLKYFVTVAKQLSFSRAAENLFVSQSCLSKQIAGLESELGTQLFVRTGRSIKLTNAGQKLLHGADEMLRMEKDLVLQIKELSTGLSVRHSLTISLEEPVTANDDVCSHIIAVAQTLKRRYAPLELVFKYENKPITGSLDNAESADVFSVFPTRCYGARNTTVICFPRIVLSLLVPVPFWAARQTPERCYGRIRC